MFNEDILRQISQSLQRNSTYSKKKHSMVGIINSTTWFGVPSIFLAIWNKLFIAKLQGLLKNYHFTGTSVASNLPLNDRITTSKQVMSGNICVLQNWDKLTATNIYTIKIKTIFILFIQLWICQLLTEIHGRLMSYKITEIELNIHIAQIYYSNRQEINREKIPNIS